LESAWFQLASLGGNEDLSFYQQCVNEISASFPIPAESGGQNPGDPGGMATSPGNDTDLLTIVSGDAPSVNSTYETCMTILNFKRNPNLVLGPSTINIIVAIYSLLIIGGLLANLSVCWVVVRNSQARIARNIYIINLAFSDITVCCLSMPFTMLRLINHSSWNYGDPMCRLTNLLEGVNLLVSSGTASAIAGDRLFLVRRKTARRNDLKASIPLAVLTSIWAISVVTILPTVFATGTHDGFFPNTTLIIYTVCTENWPYPSLHLLYSIFIMVVQYFIPITVIMVTHARIINIVRQRTQALQTMSSGSGSGKQKQQQQQQPATTQHKNSQPPPQQQPRSELTKRNRKTTQILLIIALTFCLQWLPFHIYMITFEVLRITGNDLKVETDVELVLFFMVHAFAASSVITNPILYGWLNTNLRHLFRAMIPHLRADNQLRKSSQADAIVLNAGEGPAATAGGATGNAPVDPTAIRAEAAVIDRAAIAMALNRGDNAGFDLASEGGGGRSRLLAASPAAAAICNGQAIELLPRTGYNKNNNNGVSVEVQREQEKDEKGEEGELESKVDEEEGWSGSCGSYTDNSPCNRNRLAISQSFHTFAELNKVDLRTRSFRGVFAGAKKSSIVKVKLRSSMSLTSSGEDASNTVDAVLISSDQLQHIR